MSKRNARYEAMKGQAQRLADMVLCAGSYLRRALRYRSAVEMADYVLTDLEREATATLEGMGEATVAAAPKTKRGRPRKAAEVPAAVESNGATATTAAAAKIPVPF